MIPFTQTSLLSTFIEACNILHFASSTNLPTFRNAAAVFAMGTIQTLNHAVSHCASACEQIAYQRTISPRRSARRPRSENHSAREDLSHLAVHQPRSELPNDNKTSLLLLLLVTPRDPNGPCGSAPPHYCRDKFPCSRILRQMPVTRPSSRKHLPHRAWLILFHQQWKIITRQCV